MLTLGESSELLVMLVVALEVGCVAYGAGVGSVPYAMVGEVFTPEYKTLGAAVLLVVR